jgi:hypothetical protein
MISILNPHGREGFEITKGQSEARMTNNAKGGFRIEIIQ